MTLSNQRQVEDNLLYDEKTSSNFQVLLKNISTLNGAVELRSLLQKSLKVVQNVMNAEASSLMLIDESTGELVVSLPTGPVKKEITGERLEQGTGIGGWVIENEKPFYSNEPKKSDPFAGELSDEFTTKSIICVPLINSRGEIFGVLEAINRSDKKGFDDQDVPVFQALADHIALAIERTRELEKAQKQLREKEMMLTEVHHRLKNNLSTITALIEMELSEIEDEDARQVLQKTCSRIDSMTEVHDLLYNSGLSSEISLDSYIERLAEKIGSTMIHPSQNINIEVRADTMRLDTERAMSCGLLLNELMMNAYKHAFKNKPEGNILIKLIQPDSENIILEVSDDGEGIGNKLKLSDSESTGGWLINVLLRRLDADVDIGLENGTTFLVQFPK